MAQPQNTQHSSPSPVQAQLRSLPGVDEVLASPAVAELCGQVGHGLAVHHVRATLAELRASILRQEAGGPERLELAAVGRRCVERWRRLGAPLPRVINGTGVILHSGLGRAPLAKGAIEAAARAGAYSLLEVDREAGRRHARDSRAGELLRELTGAQAALVVNNNAAATVLMLSALAQGREVVCSRGEMVEIGGSFRIPDVMTASGCRLVEVGCTNRTHTRDYEQALGPDTAALLVVHTSNYRIQGFVATPPLEELVALGRERGIPVLHDLGSGSLLGPQELGLGDEPPVSASIKAGVDVVTMSGDKLLGGPQAGIILGRADLLERMRRHPLARALRVDKLCLAALEATLQLFLDPDLLRQRHPVLRMLCATLADLRPRAEALASQLVAAGGGRIQAQVLEIPSETGSGALPTLQIPSLGVALDVAGLSPDELGRALRLGSVCVFTRIVQDRVCLDLRTLFPPDEDQLPELLAEAAGVTRS